MSNENTVWLCNYYDSNFFEVHGLRATFPEYSDAVLLNNLKEKKQSNQATDEELLLYQQERDNGLKINDMWRAGQYIENKNMPTKVYLEPNESLPKSDKIAFRIVNGYLVVNQTCYEVMSQFNLGKTHFSEIEILDMTTDKKVMDKSYYFINIAETREFLDLDNEKGVRKNFYAKKDNLKRKINRLNDYDIKLQSHAVQEKLDMWHDPRLTNSLFLSYKLVQAILQADISVTDLGLVRCGINQ